MTWLEQTIRNTTILFSKHKKSVKAADCIQSGAVVLIYHSVSTDQGIAFGAVWYADFLLLCWVIGRSSVDAVIYIQQSRVICYMV